jgi:hypothetical protein
MKRIVATKLQKIPIAHAMPRPVSAGFRAAAEAVAPTKATIPTHRYFMVIKDRGHGSVRRAPR